MMYRSTSARELPFLIEQALRGDFSPFAEAGLRANRGIYTGGRMGLHYAITCNEFVRRINPEDIEPATGGSFLGSWQLRDQMAACHDWPKTELPGGYFEPFRLEMPAVLVSGATDPVSPPSWGEEAIRSQLFRSGTTQGLDTGCMTKVQPPPFKLPSAAAEKPNS